MRSSGCIRCLPKSQVGFLRSVTAPHNFCIAVSAGVDAASTLHKRFRKRPVPFASSNIAQRTSPFADGLVVGDPTTCAANDSSERVCVFVEWKMSISERVPQQPVGAPSYPVMGNDCEYRCQIPVHCVTLSTGLEIVPRMTYALKPSDQSSFGASVSQLPSWSNCDEVTSHSHGSDQ